jgi:hypothetical protein
MVANVLKGSKGSRSSFMLFNSRSSLLSAAVNGVLASAAIIFAGAGIAKADVETIPNVILSGNVIPNPTFSQVNTNGNGPAYWNMGGNYTAGDIWDNANYIAPGATNSVGVLTTSGSYSSPYSQWYSGDLNSTIGTAYGPQANITLPTGASTVYLSYYYETGNIPVGDYSYVHLNFYGGGVQTGQWTDTTPTGGTGASVLSANQSTWTHVLDTIDLSTIAPGAVKFNITISSNPGTTVITNPPEFWVEDMSLSSSSTLVPVPEPGVLGLLSTLIAAGLVLLRRKNFVRPA